MRMSEFKGTPGPWYVGDLGEDGPKPRYWIITDERTWSDRVCSIPEYDKIKSSANAELISTAPDLLDACKLAFYNQVGPRLANQVKENNWQWPHGKEGLSVVSILAEHLRSVIAKALGEEK